MRYLLGTLSEAEREQLEEQYFSDVEEFENIEIAEDDVVDRYVRGKLTASEVENFKKVLATSPRLVERVKLARILTDQIELQQQISETPAKVVTEKQAEKTGWWDRWFGSGLQLTPAFRTAMMTAMAVVLFVGVLSIYGWVSSRRASQQLASDKSRLELEIQQLKDEIKAEQARTAQSNETFLAKQNELNAKEKILEERLAQLETQRTGTTGIVTTFMLASGALRSGGGQDLVVKPNSSAVEITLQLRTNEYSSYNAIVRNPERGTVHTARRLHPRNTSAGPTISFRVPANKMSPSDYTIRLEAAGSNDPVDDYFFRVVPPR